MSQTLQPQERFIEVNHLRLHYLDWAGTGRVPALALHGFALNCHSWDEVAPGLASQLHIHAVDQRGHGLSEWAERLEDYTRSHMVSDIQQLIAKLGLDRPVVIGHSMGGMNAMAFAAQHPEQLRALVLVDVGPEVHVDGVSAVVQFVGGPYEMDSLEDWVEHTHKHYPYRSKERIRKRLAVSLRHTPEGRLAKQFDARFREARFSGVAGQGGDLWGIARALRCPTLLIHGGASPVLTRAMAERFATTVKNVRLVSIPEAGHSVAGDQPEAFVKELSQFLSEVL